MNRVFFITGDISDDFSLIGPIFRKRILNEYGDTSATHHFLHLLDEFGLETFSSWIDWKENGGEEPLSKVKSKSYRVSASAHRLINDLKNLSALSEYSIGTRIPKNRDMEAIPNLLINLENLVKATDDFGNHLASLGVKRGRPTKIHLNEFIEAIVKAYFLAYGKYPPYSKHSAKNKNFHKLVCDLANEFRFTSATELEIQIKAATEKLKSAEKN